MCYLILTDTYLSVQATVLIVVLSAYISKSLANGCCGLISSENTLSWRYNRVRDLGQLLLQGR